MESKKKKENRKAENILLKRDVRIRNKNWRDILRLIPIDDSKVLIIIRVKKADDEYLKKEEQSWREEIVRILGVAVEWGE